MEVQIITNQENPKVLSGFSLTKTYKNTGNDYKDNLDKCASKERSPESIVVIKKFIEAAKQLSEKVTKKGIF